MGIDVSQAWFDVAVRPAGTYLRLKNQESGWGELITHRRSIEVKLMVLESTGGMDHGVVQRLQQPGLAVTVINPKRARDFAKTSGRLAKTDRIDAKVLAHFAQTMHPLPKPLASEPQAASDLVNRRQPVVERLNREQRRLHSVRSRTAKSEIATQIEWLKQRLNDLDAEIDQ